MHLRHLHLRPITKLSVFHLFLSVGFALVGTIWSIYLNSFLHSFSLVGFLISFFTLIEIAAFVFLIPLVEKTNKAKMMIFSLLFFILSYFLFSLYSSIYLVIILGTLIAAFASLNITTSGLLIRDNSKDENVSRNEGLIYTIFNLAWFVGPIIAGYFANKVGIKSVFLLSSAFVFFSLISFRFFKIKDGRVTKKIDHHPFKLLPEFFRKKERRVTYLLTVAISFWWAFIYVYMPIYIVSKGYSVSLVGIFLAGVTIPLVLLEFIFGKIAGNSGFKKLFFIGFISLGIFALSCFFISNIYIILALLIIASVSVSMLEPTTQAYFMDIISENDRDRYFGIYSTSVSVGTLLGSLPAALVLVVLPFKYLFFIFGIPMIILAFFVLNIKDSYEFKKRIKKIIRKNTKF